MHPEMAVFLECGLKLTWTIHAMEICEPVARAGDAASRSPTDSERTRPTPGIKDTPGFVLPNTEMVACSSWSAMN